jgi:dTMP kinase
MAKGLFLSLDGVDGAGKTTQCRALAHWLRNLGWRVTECRDPGGTAAGDRIREVLLNRATGYLSPLTETFLYMASRSQLVAEVIRPALEAGRVALCDRFLLSTVVYQGYAGKLDPAMIWQLGRTATGGVVPDYTFVLDMPVEAALARKQGPADRMEDKGTAFLAAVRQGFLAEAAKDPERFIVIPADAEPEVVQRKLEEEVGRVLARHPRP